MKNSKIAIVGLGYVGLPLAIAFGKVRKTIGFDIDKDKVRELEKGFDKTLEISTEDINNASFLSFTSDMKGISHCGIYIVTVPTPIDKNKQPDLSYLIKSSSMLGGMLKKNDLVIFESTVYPGATEEICVPLLENESGLTFNKDFFCGYSPERINPGDKKNTITNIKKITSGSNPEAADDVNNLYLEIVTAGTHKAGSIKVAEAAKVIENTQRDVNIALINELAIIFERLGIDTEEVLVAAETKWNFLPFRPGLVGGHCIGVDPYYLTHKANEFGYHPEMILAGRRLNDNMGVYIADQVIKLMTKKQIQVVDSNILVMGFTFKENCTDIRNTRVMDLIKEVERFNCNVDVYDPWVKQRDIQEIFDITIIDELKQSYYDAIIIAVSHDIFLKMQPEMYRDLGKDRHVLYDVKYALKESETDGRL
jgi:UDP-N-acetyl-D-glucosamine/UDP-N-acetyl-D-galactosamine dehydrogenase